MKVFGQVRTKWPGDERRGSVRVIEREWRGQQTGQKRNHPIITRRPGEEMPGFVNKERAIWEVDMHASHTAQHSFTSSSMACLLKETLHTRVCFRKIV